MQGLLQQQLISVAQNEREKLTGSLSWDHWPNALGHCTASLISIHILLSKQSYKNLVKLPQKNVCFRNSTFQGTKAIIQICLNSITVKPAILVLQLFLNQVPQCTFSYSPDYSYASLKNGIY